MLCLHSWRTSGDIFRAQWARAGLDTALADLLELVGFVLVLFGRGWRATVVVLRAGSRLSTAGEHTAKKQQQQVACHCCGSPTRHTHVHDDNTPTRVAHRCSSQRPTPRLARYLAMWLVHSRGLILSGSAQKRPRCVWLCADGGGGAHVCLCAPHSLPLSWLSSSALTLAPFSTKHHHTPTPHLHKTSTGRPGPGVHLPQHAQE